MHNHHHRSHRRLVVSVIASAAMLLAACGSDDNSADSSSPAAETPTDQSTGTDQSGGSSPAGAAEGSSLVEESTIAIEAAKAEQELGPPPPAMPAAPDKDITVVLCDAAAEGCALGGKAVEEAGAALGWTVRVVDGQGTPAAQNTGILQAIAAGTDGIVLAAVDAPNIGEALQAAHDNDIPVAGVSSQIEVGDGPDQAFSSFQYDGVKKGELTAQWIVADSDGQAIVGRVESPDLSVFRQYNDGANAWLEQCDTCDVQPVVEYAFATASQDIPLRIKTMLQSNPDMDYLYIDFAAGAEAAANAAAEMGREIKIATADCFPNTFKLVRNGQIGMCQATAIELSAWNAVDQLNRAFNDAPATDVGPVQMKVFDKSNAPESWSGDGDYQTYYKQVWGVD